jgi:hypothetical protein
MSGQEPHSGAGKPGGWRGRKSSAARGWSAAAKGAGWAQQPDRSAESATRWHRVQVGGWFLLAVTLIAGFLVYLMYRPMRTPLLMAAVTRYAPPWPPNAWAQEDVQGLAVLDRREVATCVQLAWESHDAGLRQLRSRLAAVRPGGPGRNVVIVYLSLHGAVDAQGRPCLIPPGAATDDRDWLPLRELLHSLFIEDRPGRVPDRVRKLLILDAGRIASNWGAGILYNAFAERLPEVLSELSVPNLAVLNSSRPGQTAWASPELGGSVFGHFLSRALQGAADVEQGNHDGKVSLQELSRYVTAHVRQWSLENRADVQTPMLYPADLDMELVYALPVAHQAAESPSSTLDPRWDDIARLWLRHHELARSRPYRRCPLAWETFQHQLLRLEQLALAGTAYDDEFRQTKTEAAVLADRLAALAGPRRLPAYTLSLAARFGWWSEEQADRVGQQSPWNEAEPPVTAAAAATSESASGGRSAAQDAEPEELEETTAAARQETADDALPADKTATAKPAEVAETAADPPSPPAATARYDYYPAAAAAWTWCLEDATRDRLERVLAFLALAEDRPAADVAEIHFLRILSEQLDWTAAAQCVPDALFVRRWASNAGAPAEAQAQYLLQSLVDRADAARRLGDDALLVGTATALAEADTYWTTAVGSVEAAAGYRWAVHTADRAAAAVALRDRAWAEIPGLARWALRSSRTSKNAEQGELRELVLGAHSLSAEIERAIHQGGMTPELAAAQTQLEARLAAWEKTLADENYRLRAMAGEDQGTLRAIEDLLSGPLVSGDDRNRLREKYLRIARTLWTATGGGATNVAEPAGAGAADAGPRPLDPLLPSREHLAVTILDRSFLESAPGTGEFRAAAGEATPADAVLSREEQVTLLTAQGATVRSWLVTVRTVAATAVAQTQQAVERSASSPQPEASVRAGASQADRLVRAAAGLVGRSLWTDPRDEPSWQLAELDLRHLLNWQARRSLDDFWGSGADGSPLYFQAVVGEYLAAARELGQPLGAPSGEERRLAERNDLLVQAAAQGIQMTSQDLLVDALEPSLVQTTSAAPAEHLPAGVSAFSVHMTDGRTVPLSPPDPLQAPLGRLPVAVAASSAAEELRYGLLNQADWAQSRSLETVVYYRGHVWRSEFFVQPAQGLEIVYEPPRYPRPAVTVFGQARQQASVVFILDCSGSMMRRLGGIETQGRLIDLARGTLEAILLRLIGPDDPFRVGVLAYGHRCGWNPAPGRHDELVVPDPARPGQFVPAPPDFALHPNSDVEAILPLGAFSDRVRRDVEPRLAALSAMGQTPLYLAIIQAIEATRREPPKNRLHVVAITDGFNDQTSGGPPGARKFRKDVEDVLEALGDRSVQLDIVGFDLVAKTPDEQTSQRDVVALATRTGGAFHSAADPSSLLAALEKSLGLAQYTVQPVASSSGAAPPPVSPVELGRTVTVEQPPGVKREYRVALVAAERPAATEIVLEGGEAIELYLTTDGQRRERRLEHRRYDRDLRASAADVSDPLVPQRRFFVGAHLPQRLGRAVRFPLSIQNADAGQFSPRPVEVWAEIRPQLPDRSLGPAYAFYDLTFEADRPVPVLTCLAPAWPDNAASATIRLWFKMSRTEPEHVVPLARFADQAIILESAPEVRFSLELRRREKPEDPHQVILIERHPPGSGLDAAKVEMWPPPERTVHRYSFETATIRHTFVYGAVAGSPLQDARLLITSRQRLAEGAVALAEPLEVMIPRAAVPLGR